MWVDVLHNKEAIFPLKSPGLVTIPLSFVVAILVSLATPEAEAQRQHDEAVAHLPEADRV